LAGGSQSDKQKQARLFQPPFFQFGLDTSIRAHHLKKVAELIRSMKLVSKLPASFISAVVIFIAGRAVAADTPEKEAHVTQIIKDVQLLPSGSPAQPAAINDKVDENTGVKTGEESRSELTFTDLTITRLSANTVFSFNKAGHEVQLGSGSILFRVPKNSGGGSIRTNAVTVGITGTTVIFECSRLDDGKLTVLEGDANFTLVKYPGQSKNVRAGQMLEVKAGATTLSTPVEVDLSEVMKKSPLITDFPPLPSQDLIIAAIRDQQASSSHGSSASHGGSVTGPPVYQGGTVPNQTNVYPNSTPPPRHWHWVNQTNTTSTPTPSPGHGHGRGTGGKNQTSSGSTPPLKGTNTTSGGPILHHTGQTTNQFKGSGRIITGKTSRNAKPTPTPTPKKH
jgi:hypothetical protein